MKQDRVFAPTHSPVSAPVLKSLLSRRTILAKDGKHWMAKGRIGDDPHMLVEIISRYPGAVVLNALPIQDAVALYNETQPFC